MPSHESVHHRGRFDAVRLARPGRDVQLHLPRLDGKSLKVKIDDAKMTLLWRGNVYRIREEESCAKYGWHAERKGEAFDFCTATQGYADFHEGGRLVQCDQDR
jgi:hypothetical protein